MTHYERLVTYCLWFRLRLAHSHSPASVTLDALDGVFELESATASTLEEASDILFRLLTADAVRMEGVA